MPRDAWVAAKTRGVVHVGLADLGRAGRVSTIWLGLDMGVGLNWAPPLIFETMVFGGPLDGFVCRYYTEAQARRGHQLAVQLVRKNRPRPLIHNGRKFRTGDFSRPR